MEIVSGILGIAGSALSGGLFGFLGSLVNRVGTYFENKQKQEFEKDRWQHEYKLQEMQMAALRAETEREIEVTNARGAWEGLATSVTSTMQERASYKWVDAIRSLTRPVLTFLLWLIVIIMMYWLTSNNTQHWVHPDTVGKMVGYLVESIVFAATTATFWWFGDRPPPPSKRS